MNLWTDALSRPAFERAYPGRVESPSHGWVPVLASAISYALHTPRRVYVTACALAALDRR